jgi:beta-glucosidase
MSSAAHADAQSAPQPDANSRMFPADFQWGTATAAYQIEGAAKEDGKGPSIWDTASHTPGKIFNGYTGDVSCDFYHRYADDVKLMADLGVKHFRFSISWPRVLPEGRGAANEKGVDFYHRLIDTLLEHDIEPHVTLYHWDLPQALQTRYGGWQSREIVKDFGDYVSLMAKRLGDRVRYWMTLNEIHSMSHGYAVGKAPDTAPSVALKSKKEFRQVVHNILLAHGTACLALRASAPTTPKVSVAENYSSYVPVIDTPENIEAARLAFKRESPNGGLIIPILTGQYDPGWIQDNQDALPDIQDGDMKLIGQPLDLLGFNCYTGEYVVAASNPKGYEVLPFAKAYPVGNMPWLHILPPAIYWGIRMVRDAVGKKDLPIFISENGYADGDDEQVLDGKIMDTARVMYFRAYLAQLKRALDEGYPLVGYFPWSLLDNFEWNWGFRKRFGLVHVDFTTLQRTPKLSYSWYQRVISEGRIV